MNVLSLFSGIGGFELGLERAGMTIVGQVEIDPYCRRVLAKHWPEVPRHDDVRTCVEWWQSEPRPRVDVICGGFPCQDISNAGRREGIGGERSGLWAWMAATVRALRPRYVLMENVAAILVRGLDVVAADLATCGYDLQWDCIPAAAVGAPHRRDRWWGIATDTECEGVRLESVAVAGGCGASVTGPDGAAQYVADADGGRLTQQPERDSEPPPRLDGARWRDPVGRGANVAYADEGGRGGWPRVAGTRGWPEPENCGWWVPESSVPRVAHGIPHRVDRLRALGNAIVPQVAEHVGRLVMAADSAECAA